MNKYMQPFALPLFALVAVSALLAGCSSETDDPKGNQIPFIRITGGPPDSLEDSYTARIWWTGWDFDGIIDHYEYLLDPPGEFTDEEIDSPEKYLVSKGGELQLRILRGPTDDSDTLRFSKTVGGTLYEMDWIQTQDFSQIFAFETPNADSISQGSIKQANNRFSGFHTAYVRCLDNDEAYSESAHLAYTAVTMTPSANITNPKIGAETLVVGTQIEIRWDGTDADSPDPRKKPSSYLYKLVKLGALDPPVPIVPRPNAPFVMYTRTPHIPWTEQSAETTKVRLFLEPGNYMFAVRAKDVAGAVEPFLDYTRSGAGGNVFTMSAQQSGGKPELCVTEPTLGTACFRGANQPPVRWEVPVGQKLFFEWVGNADTYGGTIEGYNWGVNIPDIEREGPSSGWRGWTSENGNFEPVVFRTPGINVIYVRCRDTGGVQSIATIVLTVVDFPLDRELLIVDDYKDQTWPRDNQHDAFWINLVAKSGRFTDEDQRLEFLMFHSHGDNDVFFDTPVIPDLKQLGRYRMIYYDTHGAGYNGRCGLTEAGPNKRFLGAYLGAGGKLWISGLYTAAAMVPNATGASNIVYPLEIPETSFAYEFMKIYSGEVRNDKNANNDVNGLAGVRPYPGRDEIFPAMHLDVTKQNPALRGSYGVGASDVIFDPLFSSANPNFRGQIDSVYVFGAIGPTKTPVRSSVYEGQLCGIRWFNRDAARRQGRTMWFGFEMYYFKDSEAQETFNRAVDWFREETPGVEASDGAAPSPPRDFSGADPGR